MAKYTPNMNPCRKPEEIAALNEVLNDKSNPGASKRASVILRMNKDRSEDGTYLKFDERVKETMAAEGVSQGYIYRSLRLFNSAGINGIKRINAEVKPEIQDRKEDEVPEENLKSEEVSETLRNHMAGYEENAVQKAAEMAQMDPTAVMQAKEALEQLGFQFVLTNPTLFQHMEGKNQKHAEIGGFYIGYRFGVFAIATKNAGKESPDNPFILKEVFQGTESCQDTSEAIDRLFVKPTFGPAPVMAGNEGAHWKLNVFFSGLEKTYPHAQGWNLHCYVYDSQAPTDPDSGKPIIHGLPAIDGCTYETTVHECDFTSPIKAAFQLTYLRDKTNTQGWKMRDRVNSLFRDSNQFMAPVLYIGARADISDASVPTLEMTAKVTHPDGSIIIAYTRRQEIPSIESLGSDSMEDFQDGVSKLDYITTDLAKELAGNTLQSVTSNAQAQCADKGERLKPVLVEAESGRRTVFVQGAIAQGCGQKDMLYTNNFVDLFGQTIIKESYRDTADQLNRSLHRREHEKVHPTTLQDKIARDGNKIQECQAAECEEGLEMYGVRIEGGKIVSHRIPENAINPKARSNAIPMHDKERLKRRLEQRNRNRNADEQLTIEQVMEVLKTMESDPRNTVYVMFDGVLVKKQKEERKKGGKKEAAAQAETSASAQAGEGGSGQDAPEPQKKKRGRPKKADAQKKAQDKNAQPEQEDEKKRLETYNVYILYQNMAYVIMAPTMEEACRAALGFLLKKGLLEDKELVFFSDGAVTIKKTIERYFGFRKYHLLLDFFHVQQKIYQYFTQFLKGGKARLVENAELRRQFFQLLWGGYFEQCKSFISSIDPNIVKSPEAGEEIIKYLKNRADNLYCFEVRKLARLINSSNRVEQANNELESHRQKKNGMAWTPCGSRCLAAFAMIYKNRIQDIWYRKGEISFEMFETKVPDTYMPDAA